ASIGGRYTWPILPALIAAAGLFRLSGARVGADDGTRHVDFVLIAALVFIGLQMMPLPPAVLQLVSPATARLQDALSLEQLASRGGVPQPAPVALTLRSSLPRISPTAWDEGRVPRWSRYPTGARSRCSAASPRCC